MQSRRRLLKVELSLEMATLIQDAAVEKARRVGTRTNVAVVDASAKLKAFVRMDGAWLGGVDTAVKTARTDRLFDMETGGLGELPQPGSPLYNIEHSNGGLSHLLRWSPH